VGNLRDKIKAKKSNELKHVDVDNLSLYQVEVDGSCDKKMHISKLEQLSQTLNECLELEDKEQQLSEVFGKSPPQGKKYYTLVQVSKGKSIYCRGIVLMADGVNAWGNQQQDLVLLTRSRNINSHHLQWTMQESNF